jgi:hypothetical protein
MLATLETLQKAGTPGFVTLRWDPTYHRGVVFLTWVNSPKN